MSEVDLARALERFERALAEFTAAHEAWLLDPQKGESLSKLLADAEGRLDEARQALLIVQDKLRG